MPLKYIPLRYLRGMIIEDKLLNSIHNDLHNRCLDIPMQIILSGINKRIEVILGDCICEIKCDNELNILVEAWVRHGTSMVHHAKYQISDPDLFEKIEGAVKDILGKIDRYSQWMDKS